MSACPPTWRVPFGEWSGSAAFILGGGPSLAGFDPERLRGRGRIIATNNAGLDLCRWADLLLFADQRWHDWNRDRLHLFEGERIVTRAALRGHPPPILHLRHDSEAALCRDGSSIAGICSGANAINLAWMLGAAPIVLLGFDMGPPGNWHDLHRLPPKPGAHRDDFIPAIERMAAALEDWPVLNANPRSRLRAFPFANLEELLAVDNLAAIEADKYLRIWERPEYRAFSPGMSEVERAFAVCGMAPGDRLVDYGSGTGRATEWFADRGLSVLGVDFAPNAREAEVPVVESCLWAMGDEVPPADWSFCCDVMEHVPTDKVRDVLAAIAARTMRGAYFRINCQADGFGRLIGERLHLTVRSGEWWRREVEAVFPLVDVVEVDERDVILLARP